MDALFVWLIVLPLIVYVALIAIFIYALAKDSETTYLSADRPVDEIRRVSSEARRAMDAAVREYLDEVYQQTKEMTNEHQE